MAWTTPRTWVAGEVVTAAIGNTHWRDNLTALHDAIDYVEFTAPVTVNNTSAAPVTVVSGTSLTYATDPVWVEFFAPIVITGSHDTVFCVLYDSATALGIIAEVDSSTSVASDIAGVPVLGRRKITPTAATHQYIVKAYRTTNNGSITAGAGGAVGTQLPGYIKVSRV